MALLEVGMQLASKARLQVSCCTNSSSTHTFTVDGSEQGGASAQARPHTCAKVICGHCYILHTSVRAHCYTHCSSIHWANALLTTTPLLHRQVHTEQWLDAAASVAGQLLLGAPGCASRISGREYDTMFWCCLSAVKQTRASHILHPFAETLVAAAGSAFVETPSTSKAFKVDRVTSLQVECCLDTCFVVDM